MPATTKPRRKYRPRTTATNPIALAMRRAHKIPEAEVDLVLQPIAEAFRAMREGVGSEQQWMLLAGSVELGLSIEKQGVVRGLRGHLTAAEASLAAVKHRAMERGAWQATALYWQEIEALDTFVLLHRTQLENLSEGEWRKAHEHAQANVRSAGGQVLTLQELQADQAQLQLVGGA